MICPKCKTPYTCPCKSCDPNRKNTKWSFSGDYIRCNTCGLEECDSWWLDEEVRQLCESTGTKTLTEAVEVLEARRGT